MFAISEQHAILHLFQRRESTLREQIPAPRRRLNVLTKAERRKRIFARLREGWAYDEIAAEQRVSGRADPADRLGSPQQAGHPPCGAPITSRLQLERLKPALSGSSGEAVQRGDLKAIGPLIRVIDRLDKHEQTVVAKFEDGWRTGSA